MEDIKGVTQDIRQIINKLDDGDITKNDVIFRLEVAAEELLNFSKEIRDIVKVAERNIAYIFNPLQRIITEAKGSLQQHPKSNEDLSDYITRIENEHSNTARHLADFADGNTDASDLILTGVRLMAQEQFVSSRQSGVKISKYNPQIVIDESLRPDEEFSPVNLNYIEPDKLKQKIVNSAEEWLKKHHYVDSGIEWNPLQPPNEGMRVSISSVLDQFVSSQQSNEWVKPSDDELINICILFNKGVLDKQKLADMLAPISFILDRLFENGNVKTPSIKELPPPPK